MKPQDNGTVWTLKRGILAASFTLGTLFAGGASYYTVEDTVRPLSDCTSTTCTGKINGKTAIPAGVYEIRDTYSPRFGKNMLELIGVPGFQGVRIHSGNSADDTEGCLILGLGRTDRGVSQSRAAMQKFNQAARAELRKGRLFIRIE